MMNFTEIKNNTKKAADIVADRFNDLGSIFEAYESPSTKKVRAYNDIEDRAKATPGYNNDLHVCSAGCQTFSTVYTYTEDSKTYVVKDTPSYTYRVELA